MVFLVWRARAGLSRLDWSLGGSSSVPSSLARLVVSVSAEITKTAEEMAVAKSETLVALTPDFLPPGGRLAGIFLTHFHVDHEGGLRDFPGVPLYAGREAWEASRGLRGLASLRVAHLPGLLPDDFAERLHLIDCREDGAPAWVPEGWSRGADVLGDGMLWAVPLPGHAAGQLGLMFRDEAGAIVFLVADAMWRVDWLLPDHGPRWPVRLVSHDWRALQDTLTRLRQLALSRPVVRIVPFHCAATASEMVAESRPPAPPGASGAAGCAVGGMPALRVLAGAADVASVDDAAPSKQASTKAATSSAGGAGCGPLVCAP